MSSVIFFSALLTGCIIGVVPAIFGAIKGNVKMAVLGFVSCVISGLVLGLLLAVPVCALFVYLIQKEANQKSRSQNDTKMFEPNSDSKANEILKFKALLDEGAITQEEYKKLKEDLFNR